MVDPEQILVDNLRESLRLIQRYVLIGIAASLSLLLLQIAASQGTITEPVTIPGLVIGVDPGMAKLILAATHIAVGFMALLVTLRAKEIMIRIIRDELTEAVTTYPSIATSDEWLLRIVPALAPGVLFLVAIGKWLYPLTGEDWVYLGGSFAMGVVPYFGLAFMLRRPIKKNGGPKWQMKELRN